MIGMRTSKASRRRTAVDAKRLERNTVEATC
jgi:hypothetical protein